jgi:hypothetical protein
MSWQKEKTSRTRLAVTVQMLTLNGHPLGLTKLDMPYNTSANTSDFPASRYSCVFNVQEHTVDLVFM